jgi:hypothetical protein
MSTAPHNPPMQRTARKPADAPGVSVTHAVLDRIRSCEFLPGVGGGKEGDGQGGARAEFGVRLITSAATWSGEWGLAGTPRPT